MFDRCAHCKTALAIGDAAYSDDAGRVYCCVGCRTARGLIDELGLMRFDTLGGAQGPVSLVAPTTTDTEALIKHVSTAAGDRVCVDVDGVSCASCAWLVEKVALRTPGVRGAVLNPARGVLDLTLDDSTDRRDIARTLAASLARAGHSVSPPGTKPHSTDDGLIIRLGISAALAMTAMVSSFTLFLGLHPDDSYGPLFSRTAAISSAIVVLVGGTPFLRGAWASLRRGAPTMDVPIATGMLTAWIASLLAAREGAVVSFDTVAIFVTLMLAGRVVERRLIHRHRRLLREGDADIKALEVRRVAEDGELHFIKVAALQAGDRLRLCLGELVPTDATLDDDTPRELSFAWLTGESDTRHIAPGTAIPAGAHVQDSRGASVLVARPFSATALSTTLAPRDDDAFGRGPVASGIFPWLAKAWVVFAFVAAAAGAWLFRDDSTVRQLEIVAVLLVVTCPCAFGIAAPLAIERATALLRQRGVFVRDHRLWRTAPRINAVVFDKTGTLTDENPVIDDDGIAALRALSAASQNAALATALHSNHARARAIADALTALGAHTRGLTVTMAEHAGVGVTATVTDDDTNALVTFQRDDDGARTRVSVTRDDVTEVASLSMREALRPGALKAVRALEAAGVVASIASGDSPERARAIAEATGIPATRAHGHQRPEDKAALVRAFGGARVLAIGDGVNDAAMFKEAGACGVPATGRPQLPARADFLLLGSTEAGAFGSVKDVILVARRLRTTLRALLAIATIYNIAVVSAGLMGALTPLLVALLMPLMSVSLLLLALLLVRLPKEPA